MVADSHAAVNDIKPFGVAMEMQEWIHVALSQKYEVIRTAADSKEVRVSSSKVPDTVVGF